MVGVELLGSGDKTMFAFLSSLRKDNCYRSENTSLLAKRIETIVGFFKKLDTPNMLVPNFPLLSHCATNRS
jgi:hypothetical protein